MEGRSVMGCLDKSSFGGVIGEKPDWNGYEREKEEELDVVNINSS